MLFTYKTILSQKTQLNFDTYLYHFDLIEPKEIKFSAGQYLIMKIPTGKGPISRLYSIASSTAEKNDFELIIQIIPGGLASNYLSGLKIKDEVIFQGPAGFFYLKESSREKIFLVTGTGIAPILSMIKSNFQFSVFNFQLFWGLKSFQDIYLFNDLKQLSNKTMEQFFFKICLSQEKNLEIIPEVDRKFFELGRIDSCFEKILNTNKLLLTTADYYLCGRREIVKSLQLFLANRGVLPENIYFEKF